MNPEQQKLNEAAWQLILAKQAEDGARKWRLEAERRVINLIGLKEEGTTSIKTDYFKVATVAGLYRSLAPGGEDLIEKEGPAIMDQVIHYRPEVSVSGLKALATANPAAYGRIIKAIITKPGKPSVKVEPLGAQ